MKNDNKLYLLVLILTIFISVSGFAQTNNENEIMKITMYDGETYIGKILSDDGRELLIATQKVGNLYLEKRLIKRIEVYSNEDAESEESLQNSDNNPEGYSARYQLSPNALPLKKGTAYSVINLYGPELHYTIADNVTINLAASWIASPFTASVKYTLPINVENFNLGLGARLGSSAYLNKFRGYGGNLWLVATLGNHQDNISVTYGYGYAFLGMRDFEHYIPGEYDGNTYNYTIDTFAINTNYNNIISNVPTETSNEKPIQGSYLSLAGIKSISKKVSFTFDASIFFGNTYRPQSNFYRDESNPSSPILKVTEEVNNYTIAYFMPGVRIQLQKRRAVQISLTGYYLDKFITVNDFLPVIPMVSWYFAL